MPTYLLTWNPQKWPWTTLDADVREVAERRRKADRWSCGRTKRIRPGDRVFLIRQGPEPRGLIGSGWATSSPELDEHWEGSGAFGREALYVDVEWETLVQSPVITRGELAESPYASVNWSTQGSGITIDAEVARILERVWGERVGSHFEPGPDELVDPDYPEGAVRRVAVNAYERNASARAACIAYYGARCAVCALDLGNSYGPEAEGLIHVHHLTPVSTIRRGRYSVDPVRDLRPVCPNCHAVIHRREPPFELEHVVAMLQSRRDQ